AVFKFLFLINVLALMQKYNRYMQEKFSSPVKSHSNLQMLEYLGGQINDLHFNALFDSSSVISGQCEDDNERLCAMESCLGLKRFLPPVGLKPGSARSAGQCFTY
ncbi:MAG: hypothetical protein AB2705_12670, partial [Candidatus Thiodiazotropha sp.]